MRVDTTQYEFSHGKKPRGRGAWYFHLTSDIATDGISETMVQLGSLAEARRKAVKEFEKLHCVPPDLCEVLP